MYKTSDDLAFTTLDKLVDYYYDEKDFDEFLNDNENEIDVMGHFYPVADVLKKVDPIIYKNLFYEAVLSKRDKIQQELQNYGSAFAFGGVQIVDLDFCEEES